MRDLTGTSQRDRSQVNGKVLRNAAQHRRTESLPAPTKSRVSVKSRIDCDPASMVNGSDPH